MNIIKYINLVLIIVNVIIALFLAVRKGEGWWHSLMGWTGMALLQLSYIINN